MANVSWIWKETAEVLGVLGVVGSLIFVAFEIRQGTEAVRSSTIQNLSEQSRASTALIVENADLRAAFLAARAGMDLTDDQEFQLEVYFNSALRIQQNRFQQIRLGVLDEELAVEGIGPGRLGTLYLNHWAAVKANYPEDFQQYFERSFVR